MEPKKFQINKNPNFVAAPIRDHYSGQCSEIPVELQILFNKYLLVIDGDEIK